MDNIKEQDWLFEVEPKDQFFRLHPLGVWSSNNRLFLYSRSCLDALYKYANPPFFRFILPLQSKYRNTSFFTQSLSLIRLIDNTISDLFFNMILLDLSANNFSQKNDIN